MSYTKFDEYLAAIRRAILGKDAGMREQMIDLGQITLDEAGREVTGKSCLVKVWTPMFDPIVTIEIDLRLDNPPAFHLKQLTGLGSGPRLTEKATEYALIQRELTTAIENELVEAEKKWEKWLREQEQPATAPAAPFVARCKTCGKEFDSDAEVRTHVVTEHKVGEFELVDRDPYNRHPGIWMANIPSLGEQMMKVVEAMDRATLEKMERDPAYADMINRRLAEQARLTEQARRGNEAQPATAQAQDATPNVERKYRTTRDALERVVRDFTRKWLGDSAQRAPFADVRVEWIGQAQIEIEGKCESPKGLESFFEYLPMVKLTPTIINAEWLKVEAWAMNWAEDPDAKKTVDNFFAALIRELDHYFGDSPSVTTPTEAKQATHATPAQTQSPEVVPDRDIQNPTPKGATQVRQVIADQKRETIILIIVTIILVIIALFACIGTYLAVPQVQGIIQFFLPGATPTLTPMLPPPTATP